MKARREKSFRHEQPLRDRFPGGVDEHPRGSAARVVVKLGGSLLAVAELRASLHTWLQSQPPAHYVFVAGAGPFADALRHLDVLHGLGEEFCHWLCVRQMRTTAEICAELLEQAELCDDFAALRERLKTAGTTVFDAEAFLRHDEPKLPGTPLEIGWHVTSDSIAARLAVVIHATRLVLLKSRLPHEGARIEELSRDGYVDRFVAAMACELPPVTAVDLRHATRPNEMRVV